MGRMFSVFIVALAAATWTQDGSASQWQNFNQPGVVMDNVLSPTNRTYDGWGSWYDDGTGMLFHGTAITAGINHPSNPAGHGFIPADDPILYRFQGSFFQNAPGGAWGIIEGAFSTWEQQVNEALGVVRNPSATLGFDWAVAEIGDVPQIQINWLHRAGTAAAWVDGYPNAASFAIPALSLTFVDEYWSAAAGQWVSTNFDLDMGSVPADPGVAGNWLHPYDLFSTALHELVVSQRGIDGGNCCGSGER